VVGSKILENRAFWKLDMSFLRDVMVAVKDDAAVLGTPEMMHDEGAAVATASFPELDSVLGPPVHLRAVDEPGGDSA
jgi:hypothetical protein